MHSTPGLLEAWVRVKFYCNIAFLVTTSIIADCFRMSIFNNGASSLRICFHYPKRSSQVKLRHNLGVETLIFIIFSETEVVPDSFLVWRFLLTEAL